MRKGFTLIELLAVLTVLSIISLVTIPVITKTIKNSKQSTYDRQVEQIEQASQNWFLNQPISLKSSNEVIIVELSTLLSKGYLEKSKIINTKTGNDMEGCILITFNSNQYQYQYEENNCTCQNSMTQDTSYNGDGIWCKREDS